MKEENTKLTEELKTKTDMLLRILEEKKTTEEQVNKLKNFLNEWMKPKFCWKLYLSSSTKEISEGAFPPWSISGFNTVKTV